MRSYILHRFGRINDLRFSSLSAEAERTYTRLYELAGVLDADGLFIENGRVLGNDEIAYRIRLQSQSVVKSIKELQKAKLLHVNGKGPQIIDWKREQIDLNVKREKDRERQARHRYVTRDDGVTDGDGVLSHPVTSIRQDSDKTILSVMSVAHRQYIETNHPDWVGEAIELANNASAKKTVNDKINYAVGILENWIVEGREKKKARRDMPPKKSSSKKKLTGNQVKL